MTPAALVQIIEETTSLDPDPATLFETVDHVSTTDEHASNIAAERLLHNKAPKNEAIFHTLCDVHKCSAIMKKTTGLGEAIVSDVIKVALALRVPISMARMRGHLRRLIEQRLERRPGCPVEDTSRHRELILQTFFSGQRPTTRTFPAALPLILNGDYRDTCALHHSATVAVPTKRR